MLRPSYPSFRAVLASNNVVRVAGVHDALGGRLAQEAGFQAVWSSSFEVSAARCLPDASVLTMTEYLGAALNTQRALEIPVVADCDTGYGNALNVAHMVHEFEAAGITAVCIEDKQFPKMNSFAGGEQVLLDLPAFTRKIETAKSAQWSDEFFLIARTEAMIVGMGVDAALRRCMAYAEAGADAILIHSKAKTKDEVLEFIRGWQGRLPVVVVPTTYPNWHIDEVAALGVSVVIYANHGLRATVTSLRNAFRTIYTHGDTTAIEDHIASVADIFALQRLADWQKLEV